MKIMSDCLLSDMSRLIGNLQIAVDEFEFRENDHESIPRLLNTLRSAITDVEIVYVRENARANLESDRANK